MVTRRIVIGFGVGLALLSGLAVVVYTKEQQSSKGVVREDRVIAGGPKESLEVRHLILQGSNEQVGRALAELARERYAVQPTPNADPLRTRAQRLYIQKNYPILYDRMRGVASAFGQRLEDDAFNYSWLNYTELKAGCSVIHVPPQLTAAGNGLVSRDYDYSTGSITFGPLPAGLLHATARPYLVELHPDRGYASLAMVAYDLLSGVLDGINSEGLTVALAMDDEIFTKFPIEPTGGPGVGLGIQILRLLLDTCGNATEAKETLLQTKQYYEFIPCHFLIADRFGNSFVWEYSHAHNKEFIIENPNRPLVMTNFSLNRHLDGSRPPSAEQAKNICKRYCRLTEQLATHAEKMSEEFIKATHKKADAELPKSAEPRPPIRTFWHALYCPEQRSVQISFYLHDEEIPGQPDKVKIVRSDYQEFRLAPTDKATAPLPEKTPEQIANAGPKGAGLPAQLDEAEQKVVDELKLAGADIRSQDNHVVIVVLDKVNDPKPLLPLLHKLPELAKLSIKNPKLDNAGMAQLKGLPKLTVLNVFHASVGDEGLDVLQTLPNLREVSLGQTQITDAGLARLKGLTQLEYLGLRGTQITDAGLVHLRGLTGIGGLHLGETKITDAGLENLKGMTKLTKLNLAKTTVTDEGVAKAKKGLPFWIKIERENP